MGDVLWLVLVVVVALGTGGFAGRSLLVRRR